MRRWVSIAVGIVVVPVIWLQPSPVLADWDHPVDAEVIDAFRPPTSRFGAGNRGLEYGTVGGEPVRAVAPGVVAFVGRVGRHRHIVVDHGAGLRSTYAYLRRPSVVRGQSVRQGQEIATAERGFHLTARLAEVYVDPSLLMGGARVVIRLTPQDPPSVSGPAATPSRGPNPLLAVMDAADDLRLSRQLVDLAAAAEDWYHRECTEDGQPIRAASGVAAPSNRVLVQVGGLGSSSGEASIGGLDHDAVGYDPDHVVGFSYAGGCTPEAFGGGRSRLAEEIGAAPYRPEDTFRPVDESATALADLVESIAAARPGRPIDIAAHSLGGVVTRRAIEILDVRGSLDAVDVVFTIGSPHGGADLATTAAVAADSRAVELAVDPWIGVGSELRAVPSVLDLAEAGGAGLSPPTPAPEGIRAVAVAGGGDLVVAAEHARWEGATNVVVPTAPEEAVSVHGDLPSMSEVQREFALAVAGAAPRCVGLASVLGSALQGRAISAAEDGLSMLIGLARWVF